MMHKGPRGENFIELFATAEIPYLSIDDKIIITSNKDTWFDI